MAVDEAYQEAVRRIDRARLDGVTELDLSYMGLTEVPEVLGELTGLQVLNLWENQISSIPEAIGQLTSLQVLFLSGNQISSIPEVLGQLTGLQVLYLDNNLLSSIPEVLGQLTSLQELSLVSNQISSIPEVLGQLTSLQQLNIAFNLLSSIPEVLGQLTSLQQLYLWKNQISSISEVLCQLTRLQVLNLHSNQISSIPEVFSQLTGLQVLDLSLNQISGIPEVLSQLTGLQVLNLADNQISSIPEELSQLTSLQQLNLWGNQISSIPEELSQLTGLQELHLDHNQISSIPEELSQLTRLQKLYLSFNQISSVPDMLSQLTGLQELYLHSNQISSIPEVFGQLTGLQELYLDHNPLNPQYAAAYSQGYKVLLQYLRSIAKDPVKSNEAKLLLVGEGEVGKTSLLAALRGDEWVENRDTTHGVEIKPVTVKHPDSNEMLLLNGWDFGGQPVYRPTHQLFFSAPALYLVVWKPREGLEAGSVEYWINLIKLRAPEAKILVVATHGGPNRRQPDIDEYDIIHRFSRDTVRGFFRVDSKPSDKGNYLGIDDLKEAIAEIAAELPGVGDKVPAIWQELRQTLQARPEAYLSHHQVVELCAEHEMDREEADLFLLLSHTLGHIIHYHDDDILKDTVILKPDWLTKAISFVLDDGKTRQNQGLVEFSHLNHLWNDPQRKERYPEYLHPKFLKLMERFDISYRVVEPSQPDSNTSLIAQLLSDGRPREKLAANWGEHQENCDRENQQVCRIVDENGNAANAEGLFYRLIVRLHKYSLGREDYSQSTHWKRGLLLDDDYNGRALLEYKGTDLWITVRAPYPEYFIGELVKEVRWLVKDFWRGLNCQVMVPCMEPCGKNAPGTGLFEVKDLIERKKRGYSEERCRVGGCDEWQDIDNLLRNTSSPATSIEIEKLQNIIRKLAASQKDRDPQLVLESLNTEERAMLSQIDRQFAEFREDLADEAKEGPRLFSLKFVKPGFIGSITQTKLQLTLWCEHSRQPLPVLNPEEPGRGVYELDLPRKWLVKAKPLLESIAIMLTPFHPVAGAMTRVFVEKVVYGAKQEAIEENQKTIEILGQQLEEESGEEDPRRAKGEILRELQAFLRKKDSEKDPKDKFGGLMRVQNKRREYLWVHASFRDEYE